MDPLLQILKRLGDQGVELVLVGGMAAIAHGSPVLTLDIDVCAPLDEANLSRIIEALRGLNPRWRFRPDKIIPVDSVERFRGCRNLYITTDWGVLDVLGALPGVCTFAELAGRTVDIDLGGFTCRVLDIDTLISAKRAAGRDKDIIGVRHLEAIKKSRGQPPAPPAERE
jgi:hypothetical protein